MNPEIWRVNLLQIVMCLFSLSLTTIFCGSAGRRGADCGHHLSCSNGSSVLVMLIMQLRISHEVSSTDLPPDLARKMLSFGLRALPRFHLPSALDANFQFSLSTSLMARRGRHILHCANRWLRKCCSRRSDSGWRIPEDVSLATTSRCARDEPILALNLVGMWGVVAAGMLSSYAVVVMLLGFSLCSSGRSNAGFAGRFSFCRVVASARRILYQSITSSGTGFYSRLVQAPGRFHARTSLNTTLCGKRAPPLLYQSLRSWETSVYVHLYLRATKTGFKDLFYIPKNDIALLKNQIVGHRRPAARTLLSLSRQLATSEIRFAGVTCSMCGIVGISP